MNAIPSPDLFGGHHRRSRAPRWRCLPCPGKYPAAKVTIQLPPPAKFGPRDIVVVDGFAGGGGASEGIELALEELSKMGVLPERHPQHVTYAVNHDEPAIIMHQANHPRTIHMPANVWQVSMRETLRDNFFGLLWVSPDCRDHSSAKGGPITSRAVRDLAWVVVKWLKELPDWQRPWCIFLENVTAFAKWSPLIERPDGQGYMRDPDRLGWTFHQFVHALAQFGYSVGWKEITACEYGDPTIRKRLKLVARRDGLPVVWPEATHGDPKSDAVQSGKLQPWPVAADIIDWSLECPSIFMTKQEGQEYTKRTGKRVIRPLAKKTDARLAYGVKRHVLDAGDDAFVVAKGGYDFGLPHIAVFRGDSSGRTVTAPAPTPTANSFIKRPGGAAPIGIAEAAAVPFVSRGQHGGGNRPMGNPVHTIAASDGDQNQVISASIAPFVAQNNGDLKPNGVEYARSGRPADVPVGAATTSPTQSLVVPYLVPRYGERDGQPPRSVAIDRPSPTPVPDGNQGSLAAVYLAQHNTGEDGHDARRPVSTIMQKGCTQGVVAASMLSLKGSERRDGSCKGAHPAICASGQHSAVVTLPLMTAYYSTGGQHARVDDPSLTVPTKARFGLTEAEAACPPLTEAQWARARQVAEFLRAHGCWDGGEIVTLTIRGVVFVIVDIGMRMLTPRELARAQGFPDTYILDPIYKGKPLSETEQRHKIGNSVCRKPAAAVIIPNYRPPLEWGLEGSKFLEAAE